VSDDDLLNEAVAELYSADPDEFTKRRAELAAQARATGAASAAKRIGILRRPTRSAWVVNQLARAEPSAAAELATLGSELQAAQQSLDGARIRELSVRRRQLIDSLARQAFAISGQQSPTAGLREEVTATLGAALADPQVAERLRAGTLERAVRGNALGADAGLAAMLPWAAAGPVSGTPAPAASPSKAASRSQEVTQATAASPANATSRSTAVTQATAVSPSKAASRSKAAAQSTAAAPAQSAAQARALAAERQRLERRQAAIAAAERAVAEADEAAAAAAEASRDQFSAVRLIENQLADARSRLAEVRRRARDAEVAQRKAREALGRARK
jgi:hypothetical protein